MRLHTLIFALFILGARAASITDKAEVDFEKKLTEAVKEVLDKDTVPENISSEQELIDQANSVKDVENNLRNRVKIADIPVKVVVEEVKPSVKSDASENDEKIEIKRLEIDLKHPGEPQRQEHETQNPEHFVDQQQILSSIKQNVIDTQTVFNNGVAEFQQNVEKWWVTNQQVIQIQEGIKEMQKHFDSQLNKFNDTLQKFWKPEIPESIKSATIIKGSQNEATIKSGLKVLEENLKSLTDGAQVIEKGEGEGSTGGGSTEGGSAGGGFPWAIHFQNMQNALTQQWVNMTTQMQQYLNQTQQQNTGTSSSTGATNIFQNWNLQGFQNLLNQQGSNQPAASQSDENAPPKPPTIWQSFQNIFNPNSQAAQAQQDTPVNPPTPGPIVQAIQNSPLYQGAVSLGIINPPNKPVVTEAPKPDAAKPEAEKPEDAKPNAAKPETAQEGSNAVPKPEEEKKPEVVQEVQTGPIKQIIQKNPIVQGLAGAVQRLQHTISPEKPRDAAAGEKGVIVIDGGHGHKPGHGAGDNISNVHDKVAVKSAPVEAKEEVLPEEPKKEEPVKEEPVQEEKAPDTPKKTE